MFYDWLEEKLSANDPVKIDGGKEIIYLTPNIKIEGINRKTTFYSKDWDDLSAVETLNKDLEIMLFAETFLNIKKNLEKECEEITYCYGILPYIC